MQNEGYDGVIREEDGEIWEYVAFNPNQIKSADPITYDDAGNVIPLSERFNPEKEDIRYSIRLPKEEYAKLSSTIMERQHIYGRPSFDYATTFDNFYVYDYLGEGNSFINFAIPIVGNEEFIHELSKIIEDGTIDSAASLDLFLKEILVGERSYHRDIVNAIKKRRGNKGFLVPRSRGQNNDTRGISALSERSGGSAAPRGESGNSNESGNQELTQTLTTANGDMVADVNEAQGQALFSLRTYREEGRDVLAEFLGTQVKDGALTEAEAQDMVQQMDDIYAFCETMKDHYAPFGQWSEAKVRISAR